MDKQVDIPTLQQLIVDPGKVFALPPEVARTFLCGVVSLIPVLIAASSRDTSKTESPSTTERWLTVEQVVSQFGVTARWLYAHKRQLPHSQPSRKVLLFPEEKLRRWFAARGMG